MALPGKKRALLKELGTGRQKKSSFERAWHEIWCTDQKEIRKRESQILWTVYYEVKTVTKRYCEQNRIDLVISFNGEPIDPAQPQQVVRGVSKPIVYHQPGIDITPHILASLNNQTNQGAGPVGGRVGVPPQR